MKEIEDGLHNMQERIEYLEEAYRRILENLNMLISSREFVDDITEIEDYVSIMASARSAIKHLFPFREIAFLLTDESDSSFHISFCDPESDRDAIQHEIDTKIADMTFAWSLRQNRPVIAPSLREGLTLILHVLSTRPHTVGMFVGTIETSALNMNDPLFTLLTAIVQNVSYAIESAKSYKILRNWASTLEQEVQKRTVLLQDELEKRMKAEKELRSLSEELELRVMERTQELKKVYDQLSNAKKLEAIGQLAGGVAHEVRNPLNAILSIVEALFLETKIKENPEYQPYIYHIRTQVNHLARLMTDLLDLGKPVDASNLIGVSLLDICESFISSWNSGMTGRQQNAVRLVCSSAAARPKVLVDSLRIQQVLFNLVDNAAQHSKSGTEIVLQIADTEGGTSKVRIIDAGTGIPADKINRVTEPFFTMRKGGTGLGLALVKHLVESMGGEINIWNNDPPPGCTAEVSLKIEGETGA